MKITYNIYEKNGTTPIYTALHGYQINELLESIPDDVVISIADAPSMAVEELCADLYPCGIFKDEYPTWERIVKAFDALIATYTCAKCE